MRGPEGKASLSTFKRLHDDDMFECLYIISRLYKSRVKIIEAQNVHSYSN